MYAHGAAREPLGVEFLWRSKSFNWCWISVLLRARMSIILLTEHIEPYLSGSHLHKDSVERHFLKLFLHLWLGLFVTHRPIFGGILQFLICPMRSTAPQPQQELSKIEPFVSYSSWHTFFSLVDCIWNVMAHAQKPDLVYPRNGRVHLNRQGCQFSRLLTAEVCTSAVLMLDTPCSEVVWRLLTTHSIRKFPLHIPSRASTCAFTFHLDSISL